MAAMGQTRAGELTPEIPNRQSPIHRPLKLYVEFIAGFVPVKSEAYLFDGISDGMRELPQVNIS
ncbi:MAG: hypothetical protein GY789_07835 [Hyphomicrobiales bacterium]|nr:hypothetical protein [Hyphomicrobiales bacterium]